MDTQYDVFICHASEDKADIARPLAHHLRASAFKVWLDDFELTVGDSLRRTIDRGLSRSRYGVVILSPAFFSKEWPNKELDGLVAREDGRHKVILPVWHNVSADDILNYSPLLADKLAVSTSRGLSHVAERISEAMHRGMGDAADSGSAPVDPEGEIVDRLGRRMLVEKSARELLETLYELQGYLARYPHSVNALLLRDRLETALHSAVAAERAPTVSSPVEATPQGGRGAGWFSLDRPDSPGLPAMEPSPHVRVWAVVAAMAAVGLLVYVLLRFVF